jgi:PmbA protein
MQSLRPDRPMPDLFAEQLLTLAKQAGAEDAEVFQSRSQSRPVSFEANRLKQLESTQADGTALRVWKNGRPGLIVAYGEVEAQALVDRAITLSDLNESEDPELTSGSRKSYPDDGHQVEVKTLLEWGNQAIDIVRDKYPDVVCGGGWDCETENTRIVNSRGLDYSYQDTTISGYLEASLVKGDDFLTIYDGQATRDSVLDPIAIVAPILQRLDWAQRNSPAPNGRLPVLLTAKAADLLWGTLQAALNGKQVLEGASPWNDRAGEAVLASNIHLSQDPKSGPYGCPFDDEGIETRAMNFIEGGRLKQFFLDRKTGRALGTPTTGNGFRNLGSNPMPGLFNFIVAGGDTSFEDLVRSIDDGIILDQILGSGPGISGDLSVNVDLGYRIVKGEIVGRIKDTMISGNVYQTLKDSVRFGNDGEWSGSCWTPSLVVDGFSVIGKTS